MGLQKRRNGFSSSQLTVRNRPAFSFDDNQFIWNAMSSL